MVRKGWKWTRGPNICTAVNSSGWPVAGGLKEWGHGGGRRLQGAGVRPRGLEREQEDFRLCARLPLDQGLWDLALHPHSFLWELLTEPLVGALSCCRCCNRQSGAPTIMELQLPEETQTLKSQTKAKN